MRRRSPSEAQTPRGATRGGGRKRGGQSTTGGRATRHIEERRGSNGVCVQRVGFSRVVRAGRSRVLGRVLGFRGAPPTRGPRARGRASPCPRVPPSSRRSGARHPPARRGSWETGRSYEYLVRFAREGNDGGWVGGGTDLRQGRVRRLLQQTRGASAAKDEGHRCRLYVRFPLRRAVSCAGPAGTVSTEP